MLSKSKKNKYCLLCGEKLPPRKIKFCNSAHNARYHYLRNIDEWKARDRRRYLKDKEKIKDKNIKRYYDDVEKGKKKSKKYYEENKEKAKQTKKEYTMRRYHLDENFRMRVKLGTSLNYVIRYYLKTGRVMNPMAKYCIDWEGIIKKLKPFPKNRKDYHVDHIIPLCKFDLTNWEQIQIAFAPENHQWLKVKKNLIKGGRDEILEAKE